MAVRKYRKRPTRRARRVRRSLRSKRLPQGKIYSFKRTCQLFPWYFNSVTGSWQQYSDNIISNSAIAPSITGILKFALTDLPNPTDFTMLFEQFKITGVKLRFIPYIGTENSSPSGVFLDTMAMCIDRGANDQINASYGFNSLLENQDVKLRNSQKPFSMWVGTPTFHQPADSATQVAYKSGWLDSELAASRSVDHHGVKWAFATSRPDTVALYYKVFATYYVKCRNPQ